MNSELSRLNEKNIHQSHMSGVLCTVKFTAVSLPTMKEKKKKKRFNNLFTDYMNDKNEIIPHDTCDKKKLQDTRLSET
jgi:hypothetical protein